MQILCPSMCVCDVNDNCFTFSNTSDSTPLSLYSYCGADGCHMRAVLVSSIINVATNKTLTMEDQFVSINSAKPLTDPTYLRINRMSCSSCDIKNTCSIPTPPPNVPSCYAPANTSRLYIARDNNPDNTLFFYGGPPTGMALSLQLIVIF